MIADASTPLANIFEGWEGYHQSIVHALQPLTQDQLAFRPAPQLRSVDELAAHLALGRLAWFVRLQAPLSQELNQQAVQMGWEPAISSNTDEILHWLDLTWQMISQSINLWTVGDLQRTFEQEYYGTNYRVSYQWVIWRILAHDLHHGGELAVMLGMQGIAIPELGDLGGHLNMPPRTDS